MRAGNGRPHSHPLDFDWRFTRETVGRLVRMTATAERTLVVGAPSIAAELLKIGRTFESIDRQPPYMPVPACRWHSLDLRYDPVSTLNLGSFSAAILDPPWYPEDTQSWVSQIIPLVKEGGVLLVSVWPSDVRDAAGRERLDFAREAKKFGQVDIEENALRYLTPLFERSALMAKGQNVPAQWRQGALATIVVSGSGPKAAALRLKPDTIWERFVFDDHQVALRRTPELVAGEPGLQRIFEAGWILPDVSRRNPLRTDIDLWTSNNSVARITGVRSFLDALIAVCNGEAPKCARARRALDLMLTAKFISARSYRRTARWHHID